MDPSLSWSNKSLQIVCSTLIPSFDQLIGGGFAVSSLNVIDEDCDRIYSSMLTKAYISSAIIANQRVIIFSSSIKTKNARFLKELPVQSAVNDYEEKTLNTDDALKIAFRYSNLPSYPSGDVSATVRLDFGNNIDASVLENASVDFYEHSDIISILENLISSTNIKSNVCRILIDQIDSPLSTLSVSQLPKIFHRIKVLIRQLPNSVCLATLSSDRCNKTFNYGLLETISPSIRNRIHVLSDCVVRLIGFDEDENDNNPYSADYVGFLHLLRLPRLNSLAPYNPTLEATEFGIKLRNSKRYLTIEKLALPPDLGETVNRFTSSVQVTDNKSFEVTRSMNDNNIFCDSNKKWKLIGTYFQRSKGLFLILEIQNVETYMVQHININSIYDMLIDTRLIEWPKPLQNVWNISETIGPNRRKLLGAFNYDNQLVLIFEDVIEIFNLKTRTMSKGDKVINVNHMAILSDQHGRGGIFLSSNNKSSNIKKWQYQMVTFEHKILWPNREKFFVYERKSTTDQRILDYSQIELILLSEDNSLYRSYQVDWKWAQGYIFTGEDGRIVWHLFTNLGVYLFDPPDQQNPEISFMIDPKRLISLRSLRVNFSDYFTCSKNDPAGWNQFFRVLLYMRSEKETVNRSFRYKVVLWLFSAHFLVSIIMIFIIFIINFSYRFSYRRILRPQLIGPLITNLTNNSKSNVSIATSEETVQQAVDTKVVTV